MIFARIQIIAFRMAASVGVGLVLSTMPVVPDFKQTLAILYDTGVFCSTKPVNWNLLNVIAERVVEHEHPSSRETRKTEKA